MKKDTIIENLLKENLEYKKRIEDLEKRLITLEGKSPTVIHYHYHYENQPQPNYFDFNNPICSPGSGMPVYQQPGSISTNSNSTGKQSVVFTTYNSSN